jgi:hypothetical protein
VRAYTDEAAEVMAQTIEVDVYGHLSGSAQTDAAIGVTTAPIAVDSSNAISYIETLATLAKENNISMGSIVVPEFLGNALAAEVGTTVQNAATAQQIEDGAVAKLFGFMIYSSNNLPQGVAGGLAAGEFQTLIGKQSTYHQILGLTVAKSGNREKKPGTFNQFGQVYGRGFSNTNGFYAGVVEKA